MSRKRPTNPPELVPRRHDTAEREIDSLSTHHLPADLLDASVRRLRIISLVYSAIFFLAAIFPNLICQLVALFNPSAMCRTLFFTSLRSIGPPVLSIVAGAGGLLFSRWILGLMIRLAPQDLPRAAEITFGVAYEHLPRDGTYVIRRLDTGAVWGEGGRPLGALYFESAAVIITLVLLGQVLELRARRRTGDAIRDRLGELGVALLDKKEGTSWELTS